ncbi:pentapeptide repeat-containing protein [Salegentibacter sp. JZCK2]|uniref:pentapeptide repeat-containing protein n=1 Tax=Salegentibacter tibetensis TaxID=2873600 RepID=UPI001CCD2B19|nr:pentapeptide repeat-containing protein [Salegentibacter tibetensis]MBZ9730779.1 pentapeptide repeat-containing protein [Salegentibacter tibetensis]
MKNKIRNLFNSKVNLFILLAFLGILIIIILDLNDKDFNYHDILVELHGLIYDLFVFGIVLTIYEVNRERKREKEKLVQEVKEKIERYQEEINDFRFWHSEEAKFRISGLVKRLTNLGFKKVNLSHCYLQNANGVMSHEEMQEWNFSAANLNDTLWIMNDCSNAQFYLTKLFQSSFRNVNLTNCKFDSAILFDTQFRKCNFSGVSLEDAVVHTQDWFEEMNINENMGVEELMNKYEIYEIPKVKNEIQGYKIVRK